MLRTLTAAALALCLAAGAAPAATLTFSTAPTTASVNPAPDLIQGAFAHNVTGSVTNVRLSPWAGTSLAATGIYSAVSGLVSYNVGRSRSLSLLWGSPDTWNTISFYLGSSLVDSYTPSGVNGTNLSQSLATFTNIGSQGVFDRVTLASSQPAFEYANLSVASVPVPAGAVLLSSALGGLLLLRRRRAL
ncbi:hypothetical protein [Rubellimicrobium aerolatum]|uniref:VPLPA-CTERM sorting domain-containing protein n=1 Tax=Rubellimicrobium aerolatum TaxID=490979 RepID=A0ABW0SBX6_9RHOB|nr:hypothetical protein [Rubellimicrobium aerolatum]MBP1805944.1 hypothetical protein [Rubellimicrobium aerolatum]